MDEAETGIAPKRPRGRPRIGKRLQLPYRYGNTNIRNKRIPKTTKAVRKDLHKARVRKNLTIREAAKLIGINYVDFFRIEHGLFDPSLRVAVKMARVFKTPVESLFPDIFYHFSSYWDDYYRFHGYSEREIILAHKRYSKYRLFHPRKRPRYAKKGWSQWTD